LRDSDWAKGRPRGYGVARKWAWPDESIDLKHRKERVMTNYSHLYCACMATIAQAYVTFTFDDAAAEELVHYYALILGR
jgi:hypothetical protein